MGLAQRTTNALVDTLHHLGISHADAGLAIGRHKAYVQRRLSGAVVLNLTDLEQLAGCAGMDVRVVFVPRESPE